MILRQIRARERFDLDDDEVQLIGFVAEGLSNNEIGLKLGRHNSTISTRLTRLLLKMHARDRAHLVAMALRAGVIQ